MGANIGTTITAQLVAFKFDANSAYMCFCWNCNSYAC